MRELIFKMYVFDAQDWFDSFMIALEYDRKPRERFYIPRKKILKGHVENATETSRWGYTGIILIAATENGQDHADYFLHCMVDG